SPEPLDCRVAAQCCLPASRRAADNEWTLESRPAQHPAPRNALPSLGLPGVLVQLGELLFIFSGRRFRLVVTLFPLRTGALFLALHLLDPRGKDPRIDDSAGDGNRSAAA